MTGTTKIQADTPAHVHGIALDSVPIDLQTIVDDGPLNRPRIIILFLVLLAMLADGYDISIISFAAPPIARDLRISGSAIGLVFSAGLLGMTIGAALLGSVGDWLGRRIALLLSLGLSALAMLGTARAGDMGALAAWRFATGLGMGAIAPIGLVLAGEYAPRKVRATVSAAVFLGLGAGGAGLAAWMTASVLPHHGWRVLFELGAVLNLVIAAVLALSLPESLKFLYARGPGSPLLRRNVLRLDPTLATKPGAAFSWSGEVVVAKVPFRLLFADGRRLITPILWAALFCAQVTSFALLLWLPTLLGKTGLSSGAIGAAVAMQAGCSTLAAILFSRFVDRYGAIALATLPLSGIPVVLLIASLPPGSPLLIPLVVLSGFSAGGSLTGLLAVAGHYYPTPIRANGVGIAVFVSRFGSILGPLLLGLLMSRGASMQTIFSACAIPLLLTGGMTIVLGILERVGKTPDNIVLGT